MRSKLIIIFFTIWTAANQHKNQRLINWNSNNDKQSQAVELMIILPILPCAKNLES